MFHSEVDVSPIADLRYLNTNSHWPNVGNECIAAKGFEGGESFQYSQPRSQKSSNLNDDLSSTKYTRCLSSLK
jgi:hypothetical protein